MSQDKALQTSLEDLVQAQKLKDLVSRVIEQALKKGAQAAEVGLGVSQGLSLNVRMRELENIEFNRDKSFGLTVYKDHKKGSSSTNDLSDEAIEQTVDAAVHLAQYTEEDPFSGLAEKESMAQSVIDCDLYHPWQINLEDAKKLIFDCENAALDMDKRIHNSEGAGLSTAQSFYVYGNSHGFIGAYPKTRHSLSCVVLAQDANGMQRDYEYTISRNPKDLWSPEKVGIEAARNTVARLSSEPIPTQTLPVIFRHDVAASLISHYCSAISGGRLYRKSSFLLDSANSQVFHPSIQIKECPHLKQGLGSAPFDSDGVGTKNRDLVTDGVSLGYILSAYSARKLGLPNTGNAGGVRNLVVQTSSKTFEELIKSQSKALLVTELMGQGINMVTGDYSRGAAGFLIENGKITKPVHEITIASNLKDIFKSMSLIANDVETRGNIQIGSTLVDSMMIAGS